MARNVTDPKFQARRTIRELQNKIDDHDMSIESLKAKKEADKAALAKEKERLKKL